MSAAKKTTDGEAPKAPSYRLPRESGWASAWKVSLALGLIGLLGCAVGYASDPHRFAFSWLFGVMTFLAIGLGSLFFVLALHLTGAGWAASVRRIAEFFMLGLPVVGVLALPIFAQMDELYPWMHHWRESVSHGGHEGAHGEQPRASGEEWLGASVARAQDHAEERHGASARGEDAEHHGPEHAAHEAVIESKLGYLNQPFFVGRGLFYIAVWILIVAFFWTRSVRQDSSKDLMLTRRMEQVAPAATFAFGLTLTFAAFDWMMSLEPTWFSTIFGVQYFAVSAVSSLAVLIVTMHGLRSAGHVGEAIRVDHFHDVGKLLFGFNVFWAYISFSQFMLIWYASIPEETTYYHLRWSGGWRTFSLVMVVVHFVVPFFLLLSRNVKRRVPILAFGAAWMLVAHVVEVFWLVMPYVSPGELSVHWLDVAALFAVGGAFLTVVFLVMGRHPLIPVGDPRLEQSLHLEVS